MTPTMPANLTPAEGVVVPRDLLPILEQIKMLSDPKHIEPSRQALDAIWGMAHTLETALAARPAAPTQSAAQTGEVERLRDALENTAARWLALDTDETEEAVRGYARKSVREIKDALSRPEPSE